MGKEPVSKQPRNKPSRIWSNYFPKGSNDHSMGEKTNLFQQRELGKLDIHMQKNQAVPLPYTIYQN